MALKQFGDNDAGGAGSGRVAIRDTVVDKEALRTGDRRSDSKTLLDGSELVYRISPEWARLEHVSKADGVEIKSRFSVIKHQGLLLVTFVRGGEVVCNDYELPEGIDADFTLEPELLYQEISRITKNAMTRDIQDLTEEPLAVTRKRNVVGAAGDFMAFAISPRTPEA